MSEHTDPFVVYEVVPAWNRPARKFEGPRAALYAAALWEQCAGQRDTSFVAITASGEEFGTRRSYHGSLARCAECRKPFRGRAITDHLCPGCELLTQGPLLRQL